MSDAPVPEDGAPPVEATEPELLDGHPVSTSRGQRVVHVPRADLVAFVKARRDEGWLMCLDVTAVDYLASPARDLPAGVEPDRFEVVITLIRHVQPERLRIRVQVPEADPVVPSLFELHPGTEALEREVFDLFGIRFEGHPDLTRILMPEDWVGAPLRKDEAMGRIPVQFKGAPGAR